MSRAETTEPMTLDATQAEWVDAACDRFEEGLRSGSRPRIEEYLDGLSGAMRTDLLRRLLEAELDWRWGAGDRPDRDEYLRRFPDDAGAVEDAFAVGLGLLGAGDEPTAPQAEADTGLILGRYRILRRHASDGMGVVWVARDVRLHRDVALKEILPTDAHRPGLRARFRREARVTAGLAHPGVVAVHDLGEREDGRPVYAMHLIPGETLRAALRRLHSLDGPHGESADGSTRAVSRLDLHALVGRLVDACYAVAYAHSRGIIHRDLKPANIMLGPFGETLVIDWGLTRSFRPARSAEEPTGDPTLRPGEEPELEPTAGESGTPGYMGPEQALPDPARIGPLSDVYSLGATLYSLLTGRRAFNGPRSVMREQTLAGDFPPPRKFVPSTPRALEAICLKAMALRPEDRYESAKALAEDLQRWLADEPVLAYREPLATRLARWARRHRTAVVSAVVLLATTAVGLTVFGVKIDAERRKAEANFQVADDSIREILRAVEGPDLAYLPGAESFRKRLVTTMIPLRRRLLDAHPGDRRARLDLGHVLRVTAAIGDLAGPSSESDAMRKEAVKILEPIIAAGPASTDERIEIARAYEDSGEALRAVGRPREAEPFYTKALAALGEPPVGPEGRSVANFAAKARMELSDAEAETGRFADALRDANAAYAVLRPHADRPGAESYERFLIAFVLLVRSDAHRGLGNRAAARCDQDEAARRARELSAVNRESSDASFALAKARVATARLLQETGGPANEILAALRDASDILNRLRIKSPRMLSYHRQLAAAFVVHGNYRLASGKPDEAEKDGEAALKVLEPVARAAPQSIEYLGLQARVEEVLARAALARKQRDPARDHFLAAVKSLDAALRINPEEPENKATLARCREALGGL
jgi:tetratricopeptide (TPR) repeat protein